MVIDVDGTLVDSNYLHVLAWSEAFAAIDRHPPMAAIHRLIGRGSDDLVRRLIGFDEPIVVELHAQHYRRSPPRLTALPSAARFVTALVRRGHPVVLASSASQEEHCQNLEVLGLDAAAVVGVSADDVARAKPAPDLFYLALERAQLDPTSTVVVGDTRFDVEAAALAGLRAIGVATGGFSRSELQAAGAVEAYDGVADLLAELDHSVVGQLRR